MLFLLMMVFAACINEDRYISGTGDEVLQIDAVLIDGLPIEEIKIRRTFQVSGNQPIIYDRNKLWVDNATVILTKTNELTGSETIIGLEKIPGLPGRLRPSDAGFLVQSGYRYSINAEWNGMVANAEARIPDYDISGLSLQHETVLLPDRIILERETTGLTPIIDTLDVYQTTLRLQQEIPYSMAVLQALSSSEQAASFMYYEFFARYSDPSRYTPHFLEENGFQFDAERTINAFYLYDIEKENRAEKSIRIVMLVPESIYGDYVLLTSNYIVPAIVTNVEGGVGLFVGARRDTTFIGIDVTQIERQP